MTRLLSVLPLFALAACGGSAEHALDGRSAGRAIDDIKPGMLVISELMIDPADCPDDKGEWFEVTNLTDSWLQLEGITVTDQDFYRSTLSKFELAPRERAVIGRGDADTFCGPEAQGYFDGDIALNNTGDAIHLYNHKTGILIDQTPRFPGRMVVSGSTIQLQPWGHESTRNDDLDNWYVSAECPYDEKDATPAAPNPECDVNAPAPELGWFGLMCQGYDSCEVPVDFDPAQHLGEAWDEAEEVQSWGDMVGDDLYFESMGLNARNVRAADWFTVEHEPEFSYTFYVPGSIDTDIWDHWVFLTVNSYYGDIDSDSSVGSEIPLTREESFARLGGISFSGAITELAQTQPDFQISWGHIEHPSGSEFAILELRDSRNNQRARWNVTTGERLD